MIPKHRLFADRDSAATAAADGEERLIAQYEAAAAAALPTDQKAQAAATPVVSGRIMSAVASPAMRVFDPVTNGYRDVYPTSSIVEWEVHTSDGKVLPAHSTVENAALPPPLKTRGTATATATTKATITVRASMPDQVQVQAVASGTLPANQVFQDPNTGKRYETTAPTAFSAGPFVATIAEVSSSEPGEMTHGQTLVIVSPPPEVLGFAQVLRLKATTVATLSPLYSSSGKKYKTSGVGTFTAVQKLAGDTTMDLNIVRDLTDTTNPDTSSAQVGDELTFSPLVSGCAAVAEVKTASNTPVAVGSTLVDSPTGKSYRTTELVTIPDSLTASVSFEAVNAETTSDLDTTHTLTFTPAPSGVSASAQVTSAYGAQVYPIAFEPQVVGAELAFDSTTRAELFGGQWSATIRAETDSNG